MDQYEEIKNDNKLVAIIVRVNYSSDGIHFFTSGESSQQLAYMHRSKGEIVQAHVHNIVKREVLYTQEIVFVKKGKMKTDFYTANQEYICSHILVAGDVVLLVSGGHGFEILEEANMFVVKQGSYAGAILDIPLMRNNIEKEDVNCLIDFLKQADIFTQNKNVREFERRWSDWLGVKYSVFVNSGSSANFITMSMLKELYVAAERLLYRR
jgi:hypothetical protein